LLLHPSYPSHRASAQPAIGSSRALRQSARSSAGFTLIELLIVCLIVGILAAIAIPLFFSQQENAVGAQAKSLAGNAVTAVEAYAADNQGSYEGLTPKALHNQEPDIDVTKSANDPYISSAKGNSTGYKITAMATDGDEFTITDTDGAMARTCVSTASKTGCSGAAKSSW
jgi:type IV pilus assembly protein PilA